MNTAGATAGSEDDEGCCRRKWDAGTPSLTDPPAPNHPPRHPQPPYVERVKMDLGLWMMHGLEERPGHTSRHVCPEICHIIINIACVQKSTNKSTLTNKLLIIITSTCHTDRRTFILYER